jgi:hypothetical protein
MIVQTLTHGDRRYTALLARIRAAPGLEQHMLSDAESTPAELDVPGTLWAVVTISGEPTAWSALTGGKAHSNFERRGYRGRGFYRDAFLARQAEIVRLGQPVETFIFPQPVALHLAAGWRIDPATRGQSSPFPGGPVHEWQRLTWNP